MIFKHETLKPFKACSAIIARRVEKRVGPGSQRVGRRHRWGAASLPNEPLGSAKAGGSLAAVVLLCVKMTEHHWRQQSQRGAVGDLPLQNHQRSQ